MKSAEVRAPELVMSPERAAAAYPNALSFSRRLVRRMSQERWRIDTIRLEIDEVGQGEALYAIDTGGAKFFYFVISNYFPPEQKVDRSFGINWDVSAALCEGAWTKEREGTLRNEIPKQYDGRYDPEVLCFCRGNRSERLFDHVVGSLTVGEQPDVELLGSVGYILRSTAFVANGHFGMLPFSAFPSGHPLGGAYDAQILAAYMLRHFVLDLVDAMASLRSAQAVALDRRIKRYLGVGNSAGLGLVPFIANHPHIINQWVAAHETALAQAKARYVDSKSDDVARFFELIGKATTYFEQAPLDGNRIFASYEDLHRSLVHLNERARAWTSGLCDRAPWSDFTSSYVEGHFHPEVVEIYNSILLELYPDVVASFEGCLEYREKHKDYLPRFVGELREKLHAYAWLIDMQADATSSSNYFWYYPLEAPYEPRRALRAHALGFDAETPMDLPLKIVQLQEALRAAPDDDLIVSFAAQNPELEATVRRVLQCGDLPFAEFRQNFLAPDFSPFAACRFLLAFYGMEKFDPRPPRSTKGALLQGAPLADEVQAGEVGDWPFPLIPASSPKARSREPREPFRSLDRQDAPSKRLILEQTGHRPVQQSPDPTVMFAPELKKLVLLSLAVDGIPLGVACNAFSLIDDALSYRLIAIGDVVHFLRNADQLAADVPDPEEDQRSAVAQRTYFPTALDVAIEKSSLHGQSVLFGTGPNCILREAAVLRIAESGALGMLADTSSSTLCVAGLSSNGPWLARLPIQAKPAFRSLELDLEPGMRIWSSETSAPNVRSLAATKVLVVPSRAARPQAVFDEVRALLPHEGVFLTPDELNSRKDGSCRKGHSLSQAELEELRSLAYRGLVPEELEQSFAA